MKKILFLIAIILTFTNTAFAAFSDMPTDEIYATAINKLVDEKIINGYEDNTFRPENKITRAEFSKMIVTAANLSESAESNFIDVSEDHWAKEYINNIYASGLVEGYDDGTFRPDNNITYAEISAVLIRTMGYDEKAKETGLTWPDNYITAAEGIGLFKNWKTNDLIPSNPATRANASLMICNMLNSQEKAEEDTTKNNSDKVNTKLSYAGFVVARKTRAGIKYITTDNNNEQIEYALPNKSEFPEIGSFVIYQLNSKGELKLRREVLFADKDENSLLVTDVDDIFVEFKDVEKVLDLELDTYTLDGKELKLDKYNYFIIEFEEDEFTSFELTQNKEKLKLKENDLVKFDKELNVCYIFREV